MYQKSICAELTQRNMPKNEKQTLQDINFSITAGTKKQWEKDIGMTLPDFLAIPLEL